MGDGGDLNSDEDVCLDTHCLQVGPRHTTSPHHTTPHHTTPHHTTPHNTIPFHPITTPHPSVLHCPAPSHLLAALSNASPPTPPHSTPSSSIPYYPTTPPHHTLPLPHPSRSRCVTRLASTSKSRCPAALERHGAMLLDTTGPNRTRPTNASLRGHSC